MIAIGVRELGVLERPIERGRGRREKKSRPMNVTVGAIFMIIPFVLVLIIAPFPRSPVTEFIYGIFGVYFFAICLVTFFVGLAIYKQKRYKVSRRYIIVSSIKLFALFSAIHVAFTSTALNNLAFGRYLTYGFSNITPGGIIFALPSFIFHTVAGGPVGSLIFLGVVFIIAAAFMATFIVTQVGENKVIKKLSTSNFEFQDEVKTTKKLSPRDAKDLDIVLQENYQKILRDSSRKKHDIAKSELGLTAPLQKINQEDAIYDEPIPLSGMAPSLPVMDQINAMSTDAATKLKQGMAGISPDVDTRLQKPLYNSLGPGYEPKVPVVDISSATALPSKSSFGNVVAHSNSPSFQQAQSALYQPQPSPFQQPISQQSISYEPVTWSNPSQTQPAHSSANSWSIPTPRDMFKNIEDDDEVNMTSAGITMGNWGNMRQSSPSVIPQRQSVFGSKAAGPKQAEIDTTSVAKSLKPYKRKKYINPTVDLIRTESSNLIEAHTEAATKRMMLDGKFKEFNINAKVMHVTVAPAVTRFEVQIGSGTRVNDVLSRESDLSYALGSSNLRIEKTIEGKSAIGIEVPNRSVGVVSIKDLLASKEFMTHKSPLAVVVGKNINDECVIGDIATMPHLLVAGSTGSGKSVMLNTILTSLLFRAHPDDVKLLLVDMKRVELNMYNGVPHMLIPQAIKEAGQAMNALKWMQEEMTKRYDLMEANGVNNIKLYHSLAGYANGTLERMPYILMVIDEAADLMARGKKEVEEVIKSLASLSRAAGIHIIMATQRPSVDVITGVIKTNFPVRIAFKVGSRHDSATIINDAGAEKLVGRGDMLFAREGFAQRVQGAYIENEETHKVMNFIREHNPPEFDPEIEDLVLNGPPNENNAAGGFGDNEFVRKSGEQDAYFIPILKWIVREDNMQRTVSISGIQRQFGLGFGRAGKLIDALAAAQYVGSMNGSKAREVLISREEVERLYGE